MEAVINTGEKIIANKPLVFNNINDITRYIYTTCYFIYIKGIYNEHTPKNKNNKKVSELDTIKVRNKTDLVWKLYYSTETIQDEQVEIPEEVKKLYLVTIKFLEENFSELDTSLFTMKVFYGYQVNQLSDISGLELNECYRKIRRIKIKVMEYLKVNGYTKNFKIKQLRKYKNNG